MVEKQETINSEKEALIDLSCRITRMIHSSFSELEYKLNTELKNVYDIENININKILEIIKKYFVIDNNEKFNYDNFIEILNQNIYELSQENILNEIMNVIRQDFEIKEISNLISDFYPLLSRDCYVSKYEKIINHVDTSNKSNKNIMHILNSIKNFANIIENKALVEERKKFYLALEELLDDSSNEKLIATFETLKKEYLEKMNERNLYYLNLFWNSLDSHIIKEFILNFSINLARDKTKINVYQNTIAICRILKNGLTPLDLVKYENNIPDLDAEIIEPFLGIGKNKQKLEKYYYEKLNNIDTFEEFCIKMKLYVEAYFFLYYNKNKEFVKSDILLSSNERNLIKKMDKMIEQYY